MLPLNYRVATPPPHPHFCSEKKLPVSQHGSVAIDMGLKYTAYPENGISEETAGMNSCFAEGDARQQWKI